MSFTSQLFDLIQVFFKGFFDENQFFVYSLVANGCTPLANWPRCQPQQIKDGNVIYLS
jgi:hypothetical protein